VNHEPPPNERWAVKAVVGLYFSLCMHTKQTASAACVSIYGMYGREEGRHEDSHLVSELGELVVRRRPGGPTQAPGNVWIRQYSNDMAAGSVLARACKDAAPRRAVVIYICPVDRVRPLDSRHITDGLSSKTSTSYTRRLSVSCHVRRCCLPRDSRPASNVLSGTWTASKQSSGQTAREISGINQPLASRATNGGWSKLY
jgi:hypothetical protein